MSITMSHETAPEDRNQEVKLNLDVKKNGPKGIWYIDVNINNKRLPPIPVFHIREDSHKKDIAQALVSGEPVVAFGIGNYGLAIGVEDPRRGRNPNSWNGWWDFKPERPIESKVPILLPWKHWSRVMDKRKLHPNIRPLFTYEKLKQLYRDGIVFHIKTATYDRAPHIDNRCFIQEENGKRMISLLFGDDPDIYEVADLAFRFDPQVLVGISSYNPRGENPAFSFEEVLEMILRTKKVGFKYLVRDEVGEAVGVRSSMSIFVVEEDHFYEQRRGSISKEKFIQALALNNTYVRSDNNPVYAARGHKKNRTLDNLVEEVQRRSYEKHNSRRKQ